MLRRILLAGLYVLAGCGHPTGVMTPVALTAGTPKTSQADMLRRNFRRNRSTHRARSASGSLPQLPLRWRPPFSLFAGSHPTLQHGARNVGLSDIIPVPIGSVN